MSFCCSHCVCQLSVFCPTVLARGPVTPPARPLLLCSMFFLESLQASFHFPVVLGFKTSVSPVLGKRSSTKPKPPLPTQVSTQLGASSTASSGAQRFFWRPVTVVKTSSVQTYGAHLHSSIFSQLFLHSSNRNFLPHLSARVFAIFSF